MEASVSEIHRYPLRPDGFEEPLFPTRESKRRVLDHLLRSSWLSLASEMEHGFGGGQAARVLREPVEVDKRHGRVGISWTSGRRRCRRKRRIVEVLGRWREVGAWWDESLATDRNLVRVLLSDGAVVDLALENGQGWFLVGVAD